MKKFFLMPSILLMLGLYSCKPTPAGTLESLSRPTDSIEVGKYYYADNEYVFVARFKSQPTVQTTSWDEQQGKIIIRKGAVAIYENDSILIIHK